jgi:hypothetical protein
MATLQERIANERRRMRTVRQYMAAGVDRKASGDAAFVPFYIAAADYIEAAMARLHIQDVRMGDMIREKVETVDATVEKALAELDERLTGAEQHLRPFLAARDELKAKGLASLEHFEAAAKTYSDFISSTMGHHGATTDISGKLFKLPDWEYMAAITEEEVQREQELYAAVEASLPEGLANTETG